jgi:hypothetical protein
VHLKEPLEALIRRGGFGSNGRARENARSDDDTRTWSEWEWSKEYQCFWRSRGQADGQSHMFSYEFIGIKFACDQRLKLALF